MARLVHFTLASEDVGRAQAFYSAVFGGDFAAVDLAGETLFRGSLAGLGMVICPTSMAEVTANRSRHQLRLAVENVADLVDRASASGGSVHTPPSNTDGRWYAVICDPDNNTIELIQEPGS